MPSGLSVRSETVEQMLAGQIIYRVPAFQRHYSWGVREAGQLLDDLTLAIDQGVGDHFLGAMLLLEAGGNGERPAGALDTIMPHDIIDGQQRLVTLTILIAVLRDLISDFDATEIGRFQDLLSVRAGGRTHLRVGSGGREASFLTEFIQSPGTSDEMAADRELSDGEQRILDVREHILRALHDLDDERLQSIADFVLKACHAVVIRTAEIDRAFTMFVVLNDRGKPLARQDILKAGILAEIPAGEVETANRTWVEIEETLGAEMEGLFSHIRTIHGRPGSPIITGTRAVIAAAGGSAPFLANILRPLGRAEARILKADHSGAPESEEINRLLTYLGWLGNADWMPPAMLWWQRNEDDPRAIARFLGELDRLAYAVRLLGIGASKRQARFHAVLAAVRAGAQLDGPDSPFRLDREDRRNIFYNLQSLHARSAPTCKLLLLRLNDEIAGTPQRLILADYTIEHVLPLKPARDSQWRTWFPNADDRQRCTNSLGNLLLLGLRANAKARNLDFDQKKAIYFADSVAVPPIGLDIREATSWSAADILAREARLVERVTALWRLDAPSGSQEGQLDVPAPTPRRATRRGKR